MFGLMLPPVCLSVAYKFQPDKSKKEKKQILHDDDFIENLPSKKNIWLKITLTPLLSKLL